MTIVYRVNIMNKADKLHIIIVIIIIYKKHGDLRRVIKANTPVTLILVLSTT